MITGELDKIKGIPIFEIDVKLIHPKYTQWWTKPLEYEEIQLLKSISLNYYWGFLKPIYFEPIEVLEV